MKPIHQAYVFTHYHDQPEPQPVLRTRANDTDRLHDTLKRPLKLKIRPRLAGYSHLTTYFEPHSREYVLFALAFDEKTRNPENARRALGLLKNAETHARALGATRIITAFTHLRPSLMEKRGYSVIQKARLRRQYQYEKTLAAPTARAKP